jgi:DNA-binding NarL/FixJ family response regulator
VNPADRGNFERHIHKTGEALGPRRFAAAWQTGQAMSIDDAVAYAETQVASSKPVLRTSLQMAKGSFGGLTVRERQVAALVAQGKSNREIAEILVVTERTAAVHVGNILAKLSFSSRTQIAAWAIARELVK